jgi:hypothetical protein
MARSASARAFGSSSPVMRFSEPSASETPCCCWRMTRAVQPIVWRIAAGTSTSKNRP